MVFLSGHTGRYTAEELLGLGAAAVIHKPPQLAELARLLGRLAREGTPTPLDLSR